MLEERKGAKGADGRRIVPGDTVFYFLPKEYDQEHKVEKIVQYTHNKRSFLILAGVDNMVLAGHWTKL